MSDGNSKLWMIAAGAGAIVAAALAYHFLTSDEEGAVSEEDELRAELEKVGEIGRD